VTIYASVEDRLLGNRKIDPVTGCWLWTGAKTGRGGYGYYVTGGRKARKAVLVPRAAASVWLGLDLSGSLPHVLHRCDTPACFNPRHLYLGSHQDNMRDREKRNPIASYAPRGERSATAKLTAAQVADIRRALSGGETQMSVAARFGVKQPQISRIKRGVSWAQ